MATFGCFLLMVTKRILRTFGRVTLDQILIHISMPSELIPDDFYMRLLATGWKTFFILFALCAFCVINLLLCNDTISRHITNTIRTILKNASLDCLFSFLYLKTRLNILYSLFSLRQTSDLIERYYVENKIDDFKLREEQNGKGSRATKSNLVLIVSESLETTFSDVSLFNEDLIRELTKYRKPGNYVEDMFMVNGCRCTIMSLYALQYGLPVLYFSSFVGDPVKNNLFKSKCISLFDILNANGYLTSHLQGATLKFASHDILYNSISNSNVKGIDEIPKELYSGRRKWGIWDSDLFEIAKNEITEMEKKGPFALSILTLDPHFDNALQPGAESNHGGGLQDIIRLQSKLIDEFIKWIQNSKFGENTVIVLLGDHYIMANKIGNVNMLNLDKRRIFNVILNSKAGCAISTNRKAAVFDFAPTILEAMGFEWPSHALGIGYSIYHEKTTILESQGLEYYENESLKRSMKYMNLITN